MVVILELLAFGFRLNCKSKTKTKSGTRIARMHTDLTDKAWVCLCMTTNHLSTVIPRSAATTEELCKICFAERGICCSAHHA